MSKSKSRPRLGVTPGEPAGIGPDICIQSLAAAARLGEVVYFADPDLLAARALCLGVSVRINDLTARGYADGAMNVRPVRLGASVTPGAPNPESAGYVLETLELALADCLAGNLDAIVTGPVSKRVINEGGHAFSGHTEWFAQKTNTRQVVMMLACKDLRVALLTTHLPVRAVSDAITAELLTGAIGILDRELRARFSIADPRILVCGLNPHAGEGGHLGREEADIIAPTLATLRRQGLRLTGPVPADSAFTAHYLANADVVLAMYHDQGLPVLKHAAFGEAVNITLGLPLIRTSVDHGTAFDLAGAGGADPSSLLAAIARAADLAVT